MRTENLTCLWEIQESVCAGQQKDTLDFGSEVSWKTATVKNKLSWEISMRLLNAI